MDFRELKNFLENTMEMNHIYQPVVIRYLLECKNFEAERKKVEKELAEQSLNELKFIHESAICDILGVLQKHKVIESDDKLGKFDPIKLVLDENTTEDGIDELIQICVNKIIELELKNIKNNNLFIIQISKNGSEEFNKNIYSHKDWEKRKQDHIHGIIERGDLVLFYFTSKANIKEKWTKMIVTLGKVTSVSTDKKIINFVRLAQLKGITFEMIEGIKNALKERSINFGFENLAKEGFNVFQITKDECELLIDIDKKYKNLFLCSIQSKETFKHFEDSMIKTRKISEFKIKPSIEGYEELSVWGSKNTNQYKRYWDYIEPGDLILFYQDGYKYCGVFAGTERNKQLAESLWGTDKDGKTWELIMYFDPKQIKSANVPKEKLNLLLGYTEEAYPRNNNPFYRVDMGKTVGLMMNEN